MGRTFSRRFFLRGSGGAFLSLPFLPSLLPRSAWGQSQSITKRYFSIVEGYGYGHHRHWFPTLDRLTNQNNPSNGDANFRYQTLQSFVQSQGQISRVLGPNLNPFVDKMNLIRGLNLHTRIGHGHGHMLGNIQATDGHDSQVVQLKALPTIDQVLAANRNFTPHSLDPLIVGGIARSYRRDANGNVSQASSDHIKPHDLFNRLFNPGGMPLPENGAQQTEQHPRRDILTRVFEDYQKVSKGRNISSADKRVLENVMDIVSDTQAMLGVTQTTAGCQYSHINTDRSRTDRVVNLWYYNEEQHAYAFQMYAQIFAAAAACDIHRVFDFHNRISDHFDNHPFEDFHQGHSHLPWDVISGKVNHQHIADIRRLFNDTFLTTLLTALDGVVESNGLSILDNSLVHLTYEASTVHNDRCKPCLLIGSAGGAITTGHMIDYNRYELGYHPYQGDNFVADPNSDRFGHIYHGVHYNRSLTTILQALGLQPSDYEDPSINQFFQGRTDGRIGSQNNGITRIGGYGHIGSEQAGGEYTRNSDMYQREYSNYNYHFYKDALPLPPRSS